MAGYHNAKASGNFKYEQQCTIKMAKELCYDEKVISQLKEATTPIQLSNIMKSARSHLIEKDFERRKRGYHV